MTKTIELTGEWDIPEGYTNKLEFKMPEAGDYMVKNGTTLVKSVHGNNYACFCIIPERKVIDWQKIIDNKVLCEFDNNNFNTPNSVSRFGFLIENGSDDYLDGFGDPWNYCRPAQNILFGHDGGECPLPEGVEVEVLFSNGEKAIGDSGSFEWKWFFAIHGQGIHSYKILGLSEGYSYE